MVRLGHRDVQDVLRVVHAMPLVDSAATVALLAQLIPSELVSYSEWDIRGKAAMTRAVEQPVLRPPAAVVEARRDLCSTYPLNIKSRKSETKALKISDFLSLRDLHRSDYYDSVLRPFGIEHQMRLFLPAPAEAARVFSFSRSRAAGDFSERDRTLLELLRPYLISVRGRCEDHASLTEREAEILEWVARGKTNREIASILCLSHHTVRKHLEHAFAKLGVHTRTAAIVRMN